MNELGKSMLRLLCVFMLCVGISWANKNEQISKQASTNIKHLDTQVKQKGVKPQFSKPPVMKWGVGVAAIFSPNPYKDTSDTILPIPYLSYQGDRFSFYGPFMSYRFYKTRQLQSAVQVSLYPETFDSEDSSDTALQKLNNRHYIVLAGVNQKFLSPYGTLSLSASVDITGLSNGFMLSASIDKMFFNYFKNHVFIITPQFGVSYSNHLLVDYYYGISNQEAANSGLSAYNPKGAWSLFAGTSIIYQFQKHWQASVMLRVNKLSSEITNSPMISKEYMTTGIVSLGYRF